VLAAAEDSNHLSAPSREKQRRITMSIRIGADTYIVEGDLLEFFEASKEHKLWQLCFMPDVMVWPETLQRVQNELRA
jgi:hypothetical protein